MEQENEQEFPDGDCKEMVTFMISMALKSSCLGLHACAGYELQVHCEKEKSYLHEKRIMVLNGAWYLTPIGTRPKKNLGIPVR